MSNKRSAIRREMAAIMASYDERWLRAASTEVCKNLNRLLENEYGRSVSIVLAWTKFFTGEADLSSFISEQIEKRSVYLPRSLPDFSMNFISIGRDWGEMVESGMYGIPEPGARSGELYDITQSAATAVVIPGMAFDRSGNRLGRGKGYYDRFLSLPGMVNAVKIGVSWSLQIVDHIPALSHDVPMDWLCHEEGYVRTAPSGAAHGLL
ncbi:MAG: 5-formyltetrahydrofolate cyclo-ligase [Deltaproteobacteria bacterium]|nr:5-formyltetrahydrofolate cyclo-ligase [Deltaproteobacteria bacterium]